MKYLILIFVLLTACKKKENVKKEEMNKSSIFLKGDTIIKKNNFKSQIPKIKTENNEMIYSVVYDFLKYETINSIFNPSVVNEVEVVNKHNPKQTDKKETICIKERNTLEYYISQSKKILLKASIYDPSILGLENVTIGMTIEELSEVLKEPIDLNNETFLITDIENSTHLIFNFKSGKLFSINVKINYLG